MKVIILICLAIMPYIALAHPYLTGTDREANQLIDALCRFPKGLELVNNATKEGPITLKFSRNHSMAFGAMWQCGPRMITLDASKSTSYGIRLRHLIFELHNAITTKEDARLCQLASQGKISCDQFVVEVEKIEHRNVIKTASLIDQGIRSRYLPSDSRWEIVHDFILHYQIQQLSGHSDAIAEEYRHMAPVNHRLPYRGTIAGLKTSSQKENAKRAANLYWNYLNS